MPVDMRAKPYYLDDEAVQWVEDTIASMSLEEKIGQLFFNMGSSRTEEYLKMTVDKYHIGGIRYNPGTAAEVHEQNRILQENSKIPLIIACNTENGGNGACSNGTMIGAQTKIGATGDAKYAKALGKMANTEAAAIGCNLSFAPVSDIYYNWHNPVVGLRTYGNDPQRVMEMTQAYMEGAHEVPGFCCAAKHFPGDGLDDRDQHVANSVNTFSCEEWDATFGKIYANLIDNGLEAIMAGHIMLPSYTRAMNPDIKDDDIMPATLSKELLTDLLKGKMGFNGMVLTDASHMVGLTCRMKRSDMIPAAEMERVIGCAAHRAMQKEISEHALTLVKYKDADVLPMTPEKYRRIMIVYVTGLEAKGLGGAMKKLMGGGKNAAESLKEKLEAKGFEVTLYESPMDKIQKRIAAGEKVDFNIYFAGKDTIADFVGAQDLIITLVDVAGGFQAVARPGFGMTKGGGEIPWYVFELPVIVIGCQQPTILADIPQARTYINTYDSAPATLDVLVDELMAGPEAFKGKDPIDSFCGMWDTHL